MKKAVTLIVILIVIAGAVLWYKNSMPSLPNSEDNNSTSTDSVPVSGTVKVSGGLSEYRNDELGFSVKYPTTWEAEEANAGVNFIMPIEKNQVSTVATVQSNVQVTAGTCAFPPVTTGVKERTTVKVGDKTFNMISLSSLVQGRTYNNRMYSYQKEKICYMFSFAAITQSLASKNLTGSSATQAENNNKAIVTSAEKSFSEMINTFTLVTGPAGTDETQAPKI